MKKFKKVLIANRGEIASRVARSCRNLGYRSVAVFSQADARSPHVFACDEAVGIGGESARESYLDIRKILDACRRAQADAVHPGYGFLAENPDFAKAVLDAGLVFIGPPVDAIRLMGNKAEAKRRMIEAGVPCVPGYQGREQGDEVFLKEARMIGFPVMVKAAAGGGGRGMRLVHSEEGFLQALSAARREALSAFGSDELILEKAVLCPRHVEIQVMADAHGEVVHLGERECSIQRRHQKVIEEAPSFAVDEELRARMGDAAVRVARAIGYQGAGTVEFLLDEERRFYFLEMNTRIQVEHPVTEMVTDLDLVALQLQVASGEPLGFGQESVRLRGHAIEARLYAEDPDRDFMPQSGHLFFFSTPSFEGIRVDAGVESGARVSPFYDPMLAKVIAHGKTREEARRKLVLALEETATLGIVTNRAFLVSCLEEPLFMEGKTSTDFIDKTFSKEKGQTPPVRETALAALLFCLKGQESQNLPSRLRFWTNQEDFFSCFRLRVGEKEIFCKVEAKEANTFLVRVEDEAVEMETLALHPHEIVYGAKGVVFRAFYGFSGKTLYLAKGPWDGVFEEELFLPAAGREKAGSGELLAPMAGKVVAIKKKEGEEVKKGETVFVIEAMKMELEVQALASGVLEKILVGEGQQVTPRQLLGSLEVKEEAPL